jgi:hypothetical protein
LLLNFCKNWEILLLGDFNTPFSSNLTTNYNLTMLLSEFSLTQHVQDATHIKDLLVTRSSSNIIWQLKVENGLAYHMATLFQMAVSSPPVLKTPAINFRSYRRIDFDAIPFLTWDSECEIERANPVSTTCYTSPINCCTIDTVE